jgi:catechol 2,3-dioxygenase-like lactoylglutathione lyase family enzyme
MAGAKAKTKKKPPAKPVKAPSKAKSSPKPAPKPPKAAVAKAPVAAKPPAKEREPALTSIVTFNPPKPKVPPRPLISGDFIIDKLHQVALTATNLDIAEEFYRDILGLKFIARFDPPGLVFFGLSGGARLLLSATASQAMLYFTVDNVDDAVRELKKRGVNFLHPPAMVHRDDAGHFGKKGNQEWMAFFRDPSGNLIGLVERR